MGMPRHFSHFFATTFSRSRDDVVLTDCQYSEVICGLEGRALDVLWSNVKFAIDKDKLDYQEHLDLFMYCLERLMRAGRLKLAKNGVFLTGDINHQIEQFRSAFPSSGTAEADALEVGDLGAGIWFFSESCPAGAVWVLRNDAGVEWLEWT